MIMPPGCTELRGPTLAIAQRDPPRGDTATNPGNPQTCLPREFFDPLSGPGPRAEQQLVIFTAAERMAVAVVSGEPSIGVGERQIFALDECADSARSTNMPKVLHQAVAHIDHGSG